MSDGVTLARWSVEQVLALAPDTSAARAARGLATARPWREHGWAPDGDPPTVWGLCQGSGSQPYQTCVDLAEPAFRCSCPSRKVPCKHVLGLLLRWAGGAVRQAQPPAWVHEWHAQRADRAARAASRAAGAASRAAGGAAGAAGTAARPDAEPTADRASAAARSRARRAERITAGLDELDRWLADQVRQGIAGLTRAGYAPFDAMAARLVDAQAPGAAGMVRRLASAAVAEAPDRLLAELGLLQLLVTGYRRLDELPADLAATVRARVGLTVPAEEVLAGPAVRDRWQVIGVREEADERLTTRRVWLRGARTGRPALVLSFAPAGQALAADLTPGTAVEADLCFFPGAAPLRALMADRPGPAQPFTEVSGAGSIEAALREYAEAVAADPWLTRWPMLLSDVVPVRRKTWYLADAGGSGLPFAPIVGDPWSLIAAAGGRPVRVAAEWGEDGLRPLAAWADGRLIRT